jgi:hypothetical protein
MIDAANEERLSTEERLRLYVRRLQLWRLCSHSACHRARSCRGDVGRCGGRISDWVEAVRDAAQRELNARDPERQILIADLKERIERLGRTMMEQR